MNVICTSDSTKLVKGSSYKVIGLQNLNQHGAGIAYVENMGWYSVKNFTDTNGKPLPKIDIQLAKNDNWRIKLDFNSFEKGDILVCSTERFKTLSEGCMYKVEEKYTKEIKLKDWNGNPVSRIENYVKFVGISRKYHINNWCRSFRLPTTQEKRDISTSQVLSMETDVLLKSVRKIDISPNKNKELIIQISKAILDAKRHKLSVVDWACQKTGKIYGLKKEDFKEVLEMPLKNILDIMKDEENE